MSERFCGLSVIFLVGWGQTMSVEMAPVTIRTSLRKRDVLGVATVIDGVLVGLGALFVAGLVFARAAQIDYAGGHGRCIPQ